MSRIETLMRWIQSNPKDCFLWHALGLENIKLNRFAEALKCFEEVLKIDSDYIGTYYHLGKLHEKLGKKDSAKKIYLQGIEVAEKLNDDRSKSELEMALEDLSDN
jgi:Tetratricopeptide repeat.